MDNKHWAHALLAAEVRQPERLSSEAVELLGQRLAIRLKAKTQLSLGLNSSV